MKRVIWTVLMHLSYSNRSLSGFIFHYTATAVELGSGNDESYFANHQQMAYYFANCCSTAKTVGGIPD